MLIPVRFRTDKIIRYIQTMELVFQNFPGVVCVDPAPLRPETFRSRFRDAVRGVVEYNQFPNIIDRVKPWADQYKIEEVDGRLYIGSAEALKRRKFVPTVGTALEAVVGGDGVVLADSPDKKIVEAICVLIEAGLLSDASFGQLSVETLKQLMPEGCTLEPIEKDGRIYLF